VNPGSLSSFSRLLLQLDEFPLGAIWRAAVGAVAFPIFRLACGGACGFWSTAALFLGLLMAVRAVPLVLRRLVRPDPQLREIWASRRRLAKEFDSYQWQKLLWIGVGLLLWVVQTDTPARGEIVLTIFCLTGGALGLFFWRRHHSEADPSLQ
jgi:hypothetical protein